MKNLQVYVGFLFFFFLYPACDMMYRLQVRVIAV